MASKSRAKSDTTADNSSTGRKSAKRHKAKQPLICLICDENIIDATVAKPPFSVMGSARNGSIAIVPGYQKQPSLLPLNARTLSSTRNIVWLHKVENCCHSKQPLLPWMKNYWQSRTNCPILWVPLPLHYRLPLLLPTSQTMRQLLRYPVTYLSSLNMLDNKTLILESNTLASQTKGYIVIYSIEECPKGSPKHERFNRHRWYYSTTVHQRSLLSGEIQKL